MSRTLSPATSVLPVETRILDASRKEVDEHYLEVLNARRRGLHKLVEAARRREARFSWVEYPDRLARFGFPHLETWVDVFGRTRGISDQPAEDAGAELVKDHADPLGRRRRFSGRL